MNKEIFYHNDTAYVVLRKIDLHSLNPNNYGIASDNWKLVLKAWKEHYDADHILKINETFLICNIVEDAKIID